MTILPKNRLSLRLVLIVPYLALVLGLAGTIGLLSYLAGSNAVSTLSDHVLIETASRISQAVDRHIVGSGATLEAAFPDGMPAPVTIESDLANLRTRFWIATSLHIDPNNYVYYGNRAGQNIGLFRHSLGEGELRIKLKAEDTRTVYRFSGINGDLNFDRRENRLFDPRQRPWFKAGENTSSDTWTAVYIDFGTQELVATRARRVLNTAGQFEGVVATDMSLRALNDFVRRLKVSPQGLAFIVEPNGDLIASSVSPNVRAVPGGASARINAMDSGSPLLTATWTEIRRQLAGGGEPGLPQTLSFDDDHGRHVHVAFDRIRDRAGLEWITVVAMPREDFMGGVMRNVGRTVVAALLAGLLAVLIGLRVINWVTGDIKRLSVAARQLGEGRFDLPVNVARRDEIGELARSFTAMRDQLGTDSLTGLANRDAFLRRVDRDIGAARAGAGAPFAVLFLDLDGFKGVNDSHGHFAGDQVLKALSARLSARMRDVDLIARFAGDEFVVLGSGIESDGDLAAFRGRIVAAFAEPINITGGDGRSLRVNVGCSIGAARYPGDADDANTLVKTADRNMYAAKLGLADQSRNPAA
ncbi:diguanylate cyclase domain-containing protein [Derxia gummosa]|uniref:Diguanylate cyclase domain-containing protein n=1 Tax=Derxia gummosa DSM 723 TaxID=1121388 RepID=A0A8B6X0T5_9BURK|nr:diguanylate cyclase [Derxia gummosa]